MSENVDNMVLEQLRLIREDLKGVHTKLDVMDERLSTVEGKMDGTSVILVGLGKAIHDIDERVEHIEQKLGSST